MENLVGGRWKKHLQSIWTWADFINLTLFMVQVPRSHPCSLSHHCDIRQWQMPMQLYIMLLLRGSDLANTPDETKYYETTFVFYLQQASLSIHLLAVFTLDRGFADPDSTQCDKHQHPLLKGADFCLSERVDFLVYRSSNTLEMSRWEPTSHEPSASHARAGCGPRDSALFQGSRGLDCVSTALRSRCKTEECATLTSFNALLLSILLGFAQAGRLQLNR